MLLAATACGGGGRAPANGLLRRPVAAPSFVGANLAGGPPVAVPVPGAVTVVSFYGSWCPECRAETPELVAVAKAHPDVRFVGVDVLDSQRNGQRFATSYSLPYPSIFDADGVDLARFHGVNPTSVPVTLVIDRRGRVVARYVGRVGDQAAFSAVLLTVAAEP